MSKNSESSTENTENKQVFTVSQLNKRVKRLLEMHFPLIWVEGEISNLSQPGSGHWYFTLKDEKAQVKCAMFRGRNSRVNFKPQNGDRVKIRAQVSLYEGRGDFQLIAEHMEEAGTGLLQKRYEELKQKLFEQGLFDEAFKKPLPEIPKHIAIITSPTGAAVQDVLSVIKRRFPSVAVSILPSLVQGQEASDTLIEAIEFANQLNKFDVILLTRGGGSIEDLWCFNNEQLARAIYASDIPVVSAVGHEIDFTIADFVADLRAPTPSAAAELICPDSEYLAGQITYFNQRLSSLIKIKLNQSKSDLALLRSNLKHPRDNIRHWMQQIDHIEQRLVQAALLKVSSDRHRFDKVIAKFSLSPIQSKLSNQSSTLSALTTRLRNALEQKLKTKQQQFASSLRALNTVSPLATLERGYSISKKPSGEIVRSCAQVSSNQQLDIQLSDGVVHTNITHVEPAKSNNE